MPTEIRRLIFTENEVMDAMTQFINTNRTSIEPGRVIAMEVGTNEPVSLNCRVQGKSGLQTEQVFDTTFLGAGLIAWCMRNKIPLARSARKSVRLTQTGKVALDITL